MAQQSDRSGHDASLRISGRKLAEAKNFAAGVMMAYLVIAYGVHHLYPFYVFDMYDQPPPRSSSRIVARGADGQIRDVTDFARWRCAGSVLQPIEPCGGCDGSKARDRETLSYIKSHPLAGHVGKQTDLIRRVYTFGTEGSDTTVRDYLIERCEAEPG